MSTGTASDAEDAHSADSSFLRDNPQLLSPALHEDTKLQLQSQKLSDEKQGMSDTDYSTSSAASAASVAAVDLLGRGAEDTRQTSILRAVKFGTYSDVLLSFEEELATHGERPRLPVGIVGHVASREKQEWQSDDEHQQDTVQICRFLVSRGRVPFDLGDGMGRTPLFHAAAKGKYELMSYLLYLKAAINEVDILGETPLFSAAGHGQADCVRFLLDRNAKVNHVNEEGHTALFGAAAGGHFHTMERLLYDMSFEDVRAVDTESQTALFFACNGPCCMRLIRHHIDPNAQDMRGQSALFHAARYGPEDRARALILGQADVNMRDQSQQTAVFQATFYQQIEIVYMLITEFRADPSLRDKNRISAIDILSNQPATEVCAEMQLLFASAGSKCGKVMSKGVAECRGYGRRRLAVKYGSLETVLALGGCAYCRQQSDTCGVVLLSDAVARAHQGDLLQVCKFLVEEIGIGANSVDELSKQTALFHAAGAGCLGMCRYLVEQRCDIHAVDARGRTALFEAVAAGQADVCDYMIETIFANLVEQKQAPSKATSAPGCLAHDAARKLAQELGFKATASRLSQIEELCHASLTPQQQKLAAQEECSVALAKRESLRRQEIAAEAQQSRGTVAEESDLQEQDDNADEVAWYVLRAEDPAFPPGQKYFRIGSAEEAAVFQHIQMDLAASPLQDCRDFSARLEAQNSSRSARRRRTIEFDSADIPCSRGSSEEPPRRTKKHKASNSDEAGESLMNTDEFC